MHIHTVYVLFINKWQPHSW